jgi:hypothetical protein
MKNALYSILPLVIGVLFFSISEINTVSKTEPIKSEVVKTDSEIETVNFKEMTEEIPTIFSMESNCLGDDCDAGGPGSSSCSYELGPASCDVECQDGYYSCCSLKVGCKCRPNKPKQLPPGYY